MARPVLSWDVVDYPEPHLERTRALLKAHPEVRGLFGHERSTALWVVAIVGLQIAIALAMRAQPWWLVLIVAYGVGALADHALWTLIHDCTHNLVFKKASRNAWLPDPRQPPDHLSGGHLLPEVPPAAPPLPGRSGAGRRPGLAVGGEAGGERPAGEGALAAHLLRLAEPARPAAEAGADARPLVRGQRRRFRWPSSPRSGRWPAGGRCSTSPSPASSPSGSTRWARAGSRSTT